jgi:hypothetical protein
MIPNTIILSENERSAHEDTDRIGSEEWNILSSS